MDVKNTGIWFYGMSGCGKSYASSICSGMLSRCLVIDGDVVRKWVSDDLGYTAVDRAIQIKRVLGIARIGLQNGLAPIVSTAYMNSDVVETGSDLGILFVELRRSRKQLESVRNIYRSERNLVGIDIIVDNLGSTVICNEGDASFERTVRNFVDAKFFNIDGDQQ